MGRNRWDAVVFDYGRVLSYSPTLSDLQEFAALVGVTEPPFFELYSNTRDDYDCGRVDCHQHWQRFADAAGISLTPDQVRQILQFENSMWLRSNPKALELAGEIRSQGVRTAILSNMPPDLLTEVRKKFDWLDNFAVQIWSCEHGVIKPDPAIYHLCLQQLECEPQRVLFFDDRSRNVQAARQIGMEAHVFESAEQAAVIVRQGLASSMSGQADGR